MPTLRCLLPCLLTILALAAEDPARPEAIRAELAKISDEVRLNRAFNLIHELVRPSVVQIETIGRQHPWTSRMVSMGDGSGFVVHSDAKGSCILTNAHVVMQLDAQQEFVIRSNRPVPQERIGIATFDGESLEARLVGYDLETDLALLSVARTDLRPIIWGDSDQMQVGDYVVALGYPLTAGYSATFGNISATDKSTNILRRKDKPIKFYESYLQTDAAINPGNSGGPLVNLRGEVVGVNAAIVTRNGGASGLGFAITSRLARSVSQDLRLHGAVNRPTLGVVIAPVTMADVERLRLPGRGGVLVLGVFKESPAAVAGVKPDDAILAVDSVEITDAQHFRTRVALSRIGEPLTVQIWRDGQRLARTVIPIGKEEMDRRLNAQVEPRQVEAPQFGISFERRDKAVIITAIAVDSPAAKAGLNVGDRILRINSEAVDGLDDLAELDRNQELVIDYYHNGQPLVARLRR